MQAALAPEPIHATPHRNVRAVLARPGFRRLLAVRLLSQLGDGWFQAGLASSVFFNPEKAASPLAMAMAFAVLLVPYSTLGPFVGVLLDRWSRRTSLFYANLIRAVLVLPAAAFVWSGSEGTLFVVTALGVIACNRFFLAGLSAVQPHVVEEERLVTANSFATTAGTVTYATGLASAGLVFGLTGTGLHPYAVVAATAALAYGAAAALLRGSFGSRDLGPDHTASGAVLAALVDTARGMVAGIRHLAGRRAAAAVMTVQAVHRGFYGVLAISTLLLYRNYYAVDDAGASLSALLPVAAGGAAGSLLAAVLTPFLTRRIGGARWVTFLMATLAVMIPVLGLPYREVLTAGASFLISLATQGTKIVTDTALQQEIDDDYRGRVFSVNDTSFNLLFVFGVVVGALVLPADGHLPASMVVIGIGYAALAAWYGLSGSGRTAPARARGGLTRQTP
jgi:hypothetical protein